MRENKDPCGTCMRVLDVDGVTGNGSWFCSLLCAVKKAKDVGFSSSFHIRKISNLT